MHWANFNLIWQLSKNVEVEFGENSYVHWGKRHQGNTNNANHHKLENNQETIGNTAVFVLLYT